MDDTGASLEVSKAATATRKRRSSILKNQRPPRTPFSELEFNVATPTDTAKSRRVSFSKRTGVAEFVTNEATTTWKNFYEEHNKSLETSGHEPAAPRQVIEHIGKRIFDQQFEEIEVVDIGGALQSNTRDCQNNGNLTLDSTNKLAGPTQNFEFSLMTDHQTKVFRDELSIPTMNEMSNPININFSNLNTIGDKCDDLEEIERDLERSKNVVCAGPFNGRNMSEYIEIDLNMTHAVRKDDDCDMSITEPIQSPNIQAVAKSEYFGIDKKTNEDWTLDKENIIVNPYVAPKESLHFATTDVDDKILVFDGKKLTVQSDRQPIPDLDERNKYHNLLPNATDTTPQRKTIFLNINDDLPNFVQESVTSANNEDNMKQTAIYNDCELSMTQAVTNNIDIQKRKTIVFDEGADISITQAIPSKVIINKQKRNTIIYESDNDNNISITQAIPSKVIINKQKRNTIIYESDNDNNISITQAIPSKVIINKQKRNTIIYESDNDNNISITQAIPSKVIINKQRRNTIIYESDNDNNISITQTVPTNIINNKNDKRRTIVFEDNDISFTQAIPANLIMNNDNKPVQDKTLLYQNDISITQGIPENIIKNNEIDKDDNVSMTQAIPSNIIINKQRAYDNSDVNETQAVKNVIEPNESDKRRTVYESNISFTQEIPNVMLDEVNNKMESSKTQQRITIHDNDISVTRAVPSNIIQSLIKSETENAINNEECEITPALPNNFLVDINQKHIDPNINNSTLEKNIDKITNAIEAETFQDSCIGNVSNLSMTKPIPSNIIDLQSEILKKSNKSPINPNKNVLLKENNHEVLVYQTNQTITISKLKDIEEKDDSLDKKSVGLVDNEAVVDEISEPINNSEIKVKDTKEEENKGEIDDINKSLIKTESLAVANKCDISKGKKSILNELLDMSCASLQDVVDNEIKVRSYKLTNEMKVSFRTDSIEMLEDEKVSNGSENPDCCENVESIKNREMSVENELIFKILSKPPALDYKEDLEDVLHLHNKVEKNIENEEKRASTNRHYEAIISSELQESLDNLNTSSNNKKSNIKGNKSFKNADDTNELLEMLSDFTDGHTDEPEKPIPIEIKGNLAIENKIEPKRLSFAPSRMSIVLSREDLINNISMAQAALQQSRFEIDDESIEDTLDSPEDGTEAESPLKSVRMSTEVVKTLQFEDDESHNDTSFQSGINFSPLKKTAFGETSYMKESRAKVIPTYLKDVSDNIKALMSDLVKPIDVMPFETSNFDKSLRKSPSTCSTQIQANLLTSSQIDMNAELQSNAGSLYDEKPSEIMTKEIAAMGKKAIAEALRQSIKPISANASIEAHIERAPDLIKSIRRSIDGPVLVFDQMNPLNNVLLSQPDYSKVHKYNPILSTDAMDPVKIDKFEIERVSTCYNVESKNQSALQSGDTCPDITNKSSIISNLSKPISINRSTEGIALEVKDREMNTIIVMKETKEILETNSSLTLVDDALARSVFDVDIKSSSGSTDNKPSPVRVIYKMEHEEDSLQKMDSDFTSIDDLENDENVKSKKRIYSPTKLDKHKNISPNLEVTPKPVSKMQKMSKSPQINEIVNPEKLDVRKSPKHKNSPDKFKSRSTVQKLLTKHTAQDFKNETLTKKILEAVNTSSILDIDTISQTICGLSSLDIVASYTSSRYMKEMQDISSTGSQVISAVGSNISKMNWQPEFVNEQSSKNLVEECNSSANVVAKIDTLPFMGSRDCEWESSSGDVWIFRLLRSRIRIIIRLAHTHHNASRSRVRADTAILSLAVEPIVHEERDPLARLAVGLACRAMRHSAHCTNADGASAQGAREGGLPVQCPTAGGVPALLVRCWSQARLALRWARTLRDARARLALAFRDEGDVALKVANIPLRAVWEVHMRIELVTEEGEEAWPRVTDARAVAVLADGGAVPALDRLVRTLPRDWGHAPAAIWKIFKYLKNKTREDDILSL